MSPRGEFLTALFESLERRGVGFCVLRNYENLYEDYSSDVDLAVQPEEVEGLETCLAEAAAVSAHRLVQRARYINYSHVYWHPVGGLVRVDFDTDFRWRIFPVLTASAVITLRRKRDAFFVPHPRHESVILFLAAIERCHLGERYRHQLGRLYQQLSGSQELRPAFRAAFGAAGDDLLASQEQAASPSSEVRSSMLADAGSPLWRQARKSIIRNSFRDKPSRRLFFRYLRGDLKRLCARFRSPPACPSSSLQPGPASRRWRIF